VRQRHPSGGGRRFAIALAVLALGLLLPAVAAAETYTVNSGADGPDATTNKDCETATPNQCTLRAAIEESNASTTEDDNIFFDGSVFIGDPNGNKIVISGAFPAITDKVRIAGDVNGEKAGQCEPIQGILGPCVPIERSDSGNGLEVEADEVVIQGLSIFGMIIAINVLNESTGLKATDNWIGVKLSGENGANGEGIFIGPNSDGTLIGGLSELDRNVIGNNGNGITVKGASETTILGNYFGVAPDGVTLAHNFSYDLRITDATGVPAAATQNRVGANVGGPAAATAPCDGGCNVFASRPFPGFNNIDLTEQAIDEAPASGPTTILANYIGLNAAGAAIEVPGSGGAGVLVGGADEVNIGGPEEGEANRLTGGSWAVLAGTDAEDLAIVNNVVGLNVEETEVVEPPESAGFSIDSNGIAAEHAALIADNRIFMGGATKGIEQFATGADIVGNQVAGGETGIYLRGESAGAGNTVEGNFIESTLGNAVLIENDDNLVVGNKISQTNAAGIRVQNFLTLASTGNTIGGDEEEDENVISESQGDAIEVADDEDDETLIARNSGFGNKGLFIDLGADGPGNAAEGPNGGIQAPTISSAIPTAASGSALPGAEVRVFLKDTGEAGEIDSFLGKATADGGGWELTYGGPIPIGTNVGATQTGLLGTSELATATTSEPPTGGGPGGGGTTTTGDGKDKGKGKAKGKGKKDKTPPQTTITKGPKRTHKRTVKFKFVSSEANSTFQCKLDKKPFKNCRSPKKYKRLKPGKHVFKVRARDAAGNTDPTPAKRVFRVLK
jgi:CSLREA domain-containing protein